MNDKSNSSKRIAKNTLFLYIRMGILMIVTLYTSRVLLDKLGIEDYGIYNLVGGLAVMFTFFSSSLSNVTQRYLNIELGVGNLENATRVVRQHFSLYLLICVVVVLFAETIGIWFIYNKLVIPQERLIPALFVFQFMILSLCATLVGIVFDSQVIAHEDMSVYSYVGIYEGLAKLLICYMITIINFDRLIVYALLLFIIRVSVPIFYYVYCKRKYVETSIRFLWDISVIKGTAALVGWNSIGTFVYAINETGINVLLNLFLGPTVNAARAVAYQVNGALKSFISNFYTSIRPQITKSYAVNDWDYLYSLFYKSSKYSFFMMWILSLPFFFVANDVLNIWLKEVPRYTDSFLIWILICSLITVLNTPVWTLALAVGKLKKYTIIGSIISLLQLPISYLVLKLGFSPSSVFVVMIIVNAINIFANLVIIHSYVSFSYKEYVVEVLKPISKIAFPTLAIEVVISKILDGNIFVLIAFVLISFIQVAISIWFIGLDRNERNFVKKIIRNRIKTFREKS